VKPRRVEPPLTPAFRKDPEREAFLEDLNGALAPHEEAAYGPCPEDRWPNLFVLGAPRSGTTLVTQLIASHLNLSCINNLSAAFWAAPCFGIRLARIYAPPDFESDYRSSAGRTAGLSEPHEFGYFWSRLLGYEEQVEPEPGSEGRVDWQRLRSVLSHMNEAACGPLVYKTFMLGFYLPQVQQVLPRSCFVRVQRDPVETALSVLRLRRSYAGDEGIWVGLKPREHAWLQHEEPRLQAAGQVLFVQRALDRRIHAVEDRNVLELSYEEVCAEPGDALARVAALLRENGAEVRMTRPPPRAFERRISREPRERAAMAEAVRAMARRMS
jgi:hypothetical protein